MGRWGLCWQAGAMGQERWWLEPGGGTAPVATALFRGTAPPMGCRAHVRMAGAMPEAEQGLRGVAGDHRGVDLRRHDRTDAEAISTCSRFLDTLLEGVFKGAGLKPICSNCSFSLVGEGWDEGCRQNHPHLSPLPSRERAAGAGVVKHSLRYRYRPMPGQNRAMGIVEGFSAAF